MARRTLTMPTKAPAPDMTPTTNRRTARSGGLRSAMTSAFDRLFSAARTYYVAATQSEKLRAPTTMGPNGANGQIPTIIARSRYAKANYAWYKQAMRQLANNTAGYGITPIINIPSLKKLWDLWGPEADARGRFDIYGLTWQIAETVPTDGAILVRYRNRFENDMLSKVPLQLQLMEIDHLPIGYTQQAPNGNWIVDGVERDAIDRVAAYWVYPVHPHDWRGVAQSLIPVRVPASEIVHIFLPERVTSERGVPWAAPILPNLEFLRDYNVNELEKKSKQSRFTTFYERPIDAERDDPYDGSDEVEPNFVNPPSGAAVEVPTGYAVKFPEMPATDSNYEMFTRLNLAEIAVCIGLCVEQITLDFSKVNDRVYRAMMLEVARFVQSIQFHLLVSQFLNPTWRKFVSAAILSKAWTPPDDLTEADYMRVEWMPPARGHIHPIQEVTAFMLAVQNGFTSRQKVAAEYGYNIEEIDMQNARDAQRAKIEGLGYGVYQGWGEEGTTPEVEIIRAQERKSVLEALLKMAQAEMTDESADRTPSSS
jgi:lambda family phage portal protein